MKTESRNNYLTKTKAKMYFDCIPGTNSKYGFRISLWKTIIVQVSFWLLFSWHAASDGRKVICPY